MTHWPDEILTPDAMYAADRFAMENGRTGMALMEEAGAGIVEAIVRRYAPRPTAVLCGPGNNGGDGWIAAQGLSALGWPVRVFSLVDSEELKGDAAEATHRWRGKVEPVSACQPADFGLVIDALFGAGLSRPLEGEAARLARESQTGPIVVAADVPSGVSGDGLATEGASFRAGLTVTFHRLKPAHVLQPAASRCGEIALIDIGIPAGWREAAQPCASLNHPDLWPETALPPSPGAHKHNRGRLCVLSGPSGATGAVRLAARAGLMGGAGFVTLLTTKGQRHDLSLAEPALVTHSYDVDSAFAAALNAHRPGAVVMGPGGGVTERLRTQVLSVLDAGIPAVLDADALTVFEDDPEALFDALHPKVILTPHGGEFARLFPDLAEDQTLNKIERTRRAAERCGAVVVFKGADSVIAEPGGDVRVNTHASPQLATMGTGDVLAGLAGALLAQEARAFDAASAACWIHGEAGRRCGPGSTVLDVLSQLPAALSRLNALRHRRASQRRASSRDG